MAFECIDGDALLNCPLWSLQRGDKCVSRCFRAVNSDGELAEWAFQREVTGIKEWACRTTNLEGADACSYGQFIQEFDEGGLGLGM